MTELSDLITAEVLSQFPDYSPPFRIEQGENHIALFDASGQMLMGVPGTDMRVLAARIVTRMMLDARKAQTAKGRAAIKRQPLPCTCGSDPHKTTCPVYKRQIRERYNQKKRLKKLSSTS